MTDRIRWRRDGTEGYVGTIGFRVFTLWPPEEDDGEWLLTTALTGMEGERRYGTPDELKAEAERWLEEFVSSLGAIFPAEAAADLRARADEMESYADGGAEGRHDRSMFATGMRRAADLIEHGDVPAVNDEPPKEAGQ